MSADRSTPDGRARRAEALGKRASALLARCPDRGAEGLAWLDEEYPLVAVVRYEDARHASDYSHYRGQLEALSEWLEVLLARGVQVPLLRDPRWPTGDPRWSTLSGLASRVAELEPIVEHARAAHDGERARADRAAVEDAAAKQSSSGYLRLHAALTALLHGETSIADLDAWRWRLALAGSLALDAESEWEGGPYLDETGALARGDVWWVLDVADGQERLLSLLAEVLDALEARTAVVPTRSASPALNSDAPRQESQPLALASCDEPVGPEERLPSAPGISTPHESSWEALGSDAQSVLIALFEGQAIPNGRPMSAERVAKKALGLANRSGAEPILKNLEELGYVESRRGRRGGRRLTKAGAALVEQNRKMQT